MLSGKNNQQQSKNLDKKYSIVNKIMLTYDTPTYMFNVYKNQPSRHLMGPKNASHDMGYLYEACDQISDFCHQ